MKTAMIVFAILCGAPFLQIASANDIGGTETIKGVNPKVVHFETNETKPFANYADYERNSIPHSKVSIYVDTSRVTFGAISDRLPGAWGIPFSRTERFAEEVGGYLHTLSLKGITVRGPPTAQIKIRIPLPWWEQ